MSLVTALGVGEEISCMLCLLTNKHDIEKDPFLSIFIIIFLMSREKGLPTGLIFLPLTFFFLYLEHHYN